MIVSPLDLLNPVFHFLDAAIVNYGVYAELGINAVMPSSG